MESRNHEEGCPEFGLSAQDYEVVKKLGAGNFGTTYLMRNIEARNKLHVFKVAHPDTGESIRLETRVQNRIGIHKNIAQMYGVVTVEYGGRSAKAIDMEYVEGNTLKQSIKQEGMIEPDNAAEYTLGILSGLAFLREQGVFHRDLKPDNVMIAGSGSIKLIDFGLAKTEEIASQPFMNRAYAPPEFRVNKEFPNSDLWSVGLILYEMLTGRHLFLKESDCYKSVNEYQDYISEKAKWWVELKEDIDAKYDDRIL